MPKKKKKKRRRNRPRTDDRKFPERLPRYEHIIDLPEASREGLKFIRYDEVQTLEWLGPALRVRLNKYAFRASSMLSRDRSDRSVALDRRQCRAN